MYEENLSAEDVEGMWWFLDDDSWKEKFAWMAFIPLKVTAELKMRILGNNLRQMIIDVQRITAEATKNMWCMRCMKLHKNNPTPKIPAHQPQQINTAQDAANNNLNKPQKRKTLPKEKNNSTGESR